MLKKKTVLISVLIAIALISFAGGINRSIVNGQLTRPFGGRIYFIIPCDCSYGHVVFLGPPTPGAFHYAPFSRLYSFFQVRKIGSWLLGNYRPGTGGQCLKNVGIGCITIPNLGVMSIVGTSQ